MNNVNGCPVCNSRDNFVFFEGENFPYFTTPVKMQDKQKILKKYRYIPLQGRLEIVICNVCSHIYLKKMMNSRILSELYTKYYSYPSALNGSFLPERDNSFLEAFDRKIQRHIKKHQRKILEIGCYDGYILYNFKRQGFNVTGCDPSGGADIGHRFGIDIKKRFFHTADFLKKGLKYDIVIFRHFLEHVSKPVGFLKGLTRILRPGGMIIFEVPNINFYLKNDNPVVFSFQHLQYFSDESIFQLLKESGLKLVRLIDTGENLIVVCKNGAYLGTSTRKSVFKLCNSFKNRLDKGKALLSKMLNRYCSTGIALWGAGGFSSIVMETYDIPISKVKFIVDSDANKWRMEYLKYDIPIKPPTVLGDVGHDCLMICSMYAKEIIKNLQRLNYDKPVITLYPKIGLYEKVKSCEKN